MEGRLVIVTTFVAATMIMAFLPWILIDYILAPLGLVRAAWAVAHVPRAQWDTDRSGAPLVAAAMALARAPRLDEKAAAWLESKIADAAPARGGAIVAAAFVAFARGDRDGARALFESLDRLDDRACPLVARRLASDWLALDGAERGAWHKVALRGKTHAGRGRVSALLALAARCFLSDEEAAGHGLAEAPAPAMLWWRWLLAPRRRATHVLVERALLALATSREPSRSDAPPAPQDAAVVIEQTDAWGRALALHAAMLLRPAGAVTNDDLRELGAAWDEALSDGAMESRIAERAASLGAGGPYRAPNGHGGSAPVAIARLRASIEEDLVSVVVEADTPLADTGDTGIAASVRKKLRDDLLTALETSCEALRIRVDERRGLPGVDEWREALAVFAQHAHGCRIAGQAYRRLAFPKLHSDLCHFAVWLFNTRNQRAVGNAIFGFLLNESIAAGDDRAAALQRKNLSCGVG